MGPSSWTHKEAASNPGRFNYTWGRADGNGLPLLESFSNPNGTTHLWHDDGGSPLAMQTYTGSVVYYALDGLGSPVALISTSGAKIASYAYDPYGEVTATNITGNIATDLNPYVFTGGLKDRTTGWVKLGLRFYDPETGRFSQQDSLEVLADPSRGNRYQYAGSNPVNYVDPLGLSASSVTACFIACIALASGTGDGYSFSIGLGIGTPELSAGFAPGEDAESGGVVGEYSCGVGTLSASYTSDGEPGISVSTEEFSLVPSCSAITWFNIGF
jgi:RHS repeat-associated protein